MCVCVCVCVCACVRAHACVRACESPGVRLKVIFLFFMPMNGEYTFVYIIEKYESVIKQMLLAKYIPP